MSYTPAMNSCRNKITNCARFAIHDLLWLTVVVAVSAIVGCGKPAPRSSLVRSGKTGLLGAPLPAGVKLTQQRGADPVYGDAAEIYSIPASVTDILAFFDQAMIAEGWQKPDPDTNSSRFFTKGSKKLVVIANVDGGTFSLSGQ